MTQETTDIKLPPLPFAKMTVRGYGDAYLPKHMQEYARAAVELNRQQRDTHLDYKELCERCDVLDKALAEYEQRGEIVAYMSEDGRVVNAKTRNTTMPAVSQQLFSIPLCRYPQPAASAEPVKDEILGYRLEFRPGDYGYYTPEEYTRETCKGDSPTHTLHATPQKDCSTEIEVYKGWCWVQPKNNFGVVDATFKPLYLGPEIAAPVAAQPSTPEIPDGLKSIRDAALEEAAAAAEHVGRPVGAGDGDTYIPGTSADAAKAIRALKSQPATSTQDREDAERYRWLKANIEEGYELPGAYYIDDGDTSNWDKTIDAARAAKEPNHG